jgi:hypothetical protein
MRYGMAGMLAQTWCKPILRLVVQPRWGWKRGRREPRVGARASRQPWAWLWNAVGVQYPPAPVPQMPRRPRQCREYQGARAGAANVKGVRTAKKQIFKGVRPNGTANVKMPGRHRERQSTRNHRHRHRRRHRHRERQGRSHNKGQGWRACEPTLSPPTNEHQPQRGLHMTPVPAPSCAIPLGLRFCFGQTQGDARVVCATLVFHNASFSKETAIRLAGRIVRIFMRYGILVALKQSGGLSWPCR